MKISGGFVIAWFGLMGLSSCLGDSDFVDTADQFRAETEAIDQYLEANNLTARIDTGGYDLRYIIHEQGTGAKPLAADVSLVSITGNTLNGQNFLEEDSLYIGVNGWVSGYAVLLPYINEGGAMTMFVPSFYGYGQNTAFNGKLSAYSTMVLDVELKETMSQFDYEQRLIDSYLLDNELEAAIDTAYGLRYIIEEEGDGETYPTTSDGVNVDYSGRLLGSTELFDSNVGINLNLQNLIQGWRILMPYVSEGGKIIMFIPSEYGYGESGQGTGIPGNATLIFEVRLNNVN